MPKKKAPAKLTGGAGFRYEDLVAARFLLDLLGGTNSLGQDFGRVARVDWQARDAGWLADDLAISCHASSGIRAAGLSIKSNRQVTASGFPANFVEIAWGQWLGQSTTRKLRDGSDAVALVTGALANDVETAWSKTLSEALKIGPAAERMVARLADAAKEEGSQASEIERALFGSFRCPEQFREHGDTGDIAAAQLLRHVRLLHFDYEAQPSRDQVRALVDCQNVVSSGDPTEAAALWDRLIGFAAERRVAGGSADLAELLAGLRGEFKLRDHPDYRKDWEALDRHSREAMDDVGTEIGGLPRLARDKEHETIEHRLTNQGACFLAGESGSGKSALAKQTVQGRYKGAVWASEETMDCETLSELEERLGLEHPLVEVLSTAPKPCLVVFDGVEGYSERGLRLTARLMRDVHAAASAEHVHLLLTAQFEASRRIITRLAELDVPLALLKVTPIDRPQEGEVRNLVVSLPELRWASLRAELRPLLTNLKILDWVVRAVRSGKAIDEGRIIGLTSLIDMLWERWVEGADDDGFARSHLLMHLGILEGETLSAGVPRTRLEHGEQLALRALVTSDLIRVRDERVRFSHDLLGDWARMRVLVGEGLTPFVADATRAASPRWHRAVRLYGQRVLEQADNGSDLWGRAVRQMEDGTETGQVIRDLLLEALFLATNARQLLERVWVALTADDGRLLNRLLDRFLFVATIPDPRLSELAETPEMAASLEHLLRVPFWPYWGPMLAFLHAHRAEVARLAPFTGAGLCSLWLRTMPMEWEPGRPMPWRRHAAEVAEAIAREIQARKAEGDYFSDHKEQIAYEAALYAAVDLPDAIASLCLELAQRRDASPEIQSRAEQARVKAEAESRRFREANPERAKQAEQLCTPIFPRGRLREAWPDGPRARVDAAFQGACLDTPAFSSLVRARPEAALEVLLAVCIEEPQHEEIYGFSHSEDCGVEHWINGYPPLYFRGPFLMFLREAPEHGLSFVLRLVNFATRRYSETEPGRLTSMGLSAAEADLGINIAVDGQSRWWRGDGRVFGWCNGHPHDSNVIPSALMALERWLYEQLDKGVEIERWLSHILAESESLAFAGLLLEVGKRKPKLFRGVLRPLVATWELYRLDIQAIVQRSGMHPGLIGWHRSGARLNQLAREWYGMPHRARPLQDLAVELMLRYPDMRPFFKETREAWRTLLHDGEPERLLLLIERLNPDNYTFQPHDERQVLIEFHWPEAIERKNAEDLHRNEEQMQVMMFPWQCRDRLDKGTPLGVEQLASFWQSLQGMSGHKAIPKTDAGPSPIHVADGACGGIAVLLVFHRGWVAADPSREAWCRQKLEEVIQNPPPLTFMDSDSAIGDMHWDAFGAECGVILLAENPDDPLARLLVALGVTGYRYATTALTMRRAFQHREALADDFDRLLNLAVGWAGVRSLRARAAQLQIDGEQWLNAQNDLLQRFIQRSLPVERPSLQELNAETLTELEQLYAKHFPERLGERSTRRRERSASARRESLHPALPGIDLQVIASACGWLDLAAARSEAERDKWLRLIRELLGLSLGLVPAIEAPDRQEIDGLPSQFDNWVFGLVARSIPHMTAADDPDSLWRPILDLGTPAHHWVEYFFWQWFTDGVQAAKSPEEFAGVWTRMISHALTHPAWDPATSRTYDLGQMVFELLGFHHGVHSVAANENFTGGVGRMVGFFEQAARRWFTIPRVLNGFARFVVRVGARRLLVPGVHWLAEAPRSLDSYEWREGGLEENLVEVLRVCWERESGKVANDAALRAAFFALLTSLAARGGHAAIALRDRVLDSISV